MTSGRDAGAERSPDGLQPSKRELPSPANPVRFEWHGPGAARREPCPPHGHFPGGRRRHPEPSLGPASRDHGDAEESIGNQATDLRVASGDRQS